MKISRVGMLLLSSAALFSLSGCGIVNKVRARNELNDGAKAYKERRFDLAEQHFTQALSYDPNQKQTELFLARTLHQQYLGKRDSPENMKKAEQAIDIYQKVLADNPSDLCPTANDPNRRCGTNDAITNLLLNLKGPEARDEWVKTRSEDTRVPNDQRAEAYTLLASKDYTCANEITEAAKETVQKGNEAVFVFKKPANPEDFEKAKRCTDEGIALIDKAIQLYENNDSTWSYRASLLAQKARLAEMDNNTAEKERYLQESTAAKEKFLALAEARAKKKEEEEARKKAEEEAAQ